MDFFDKIGKKVSETYNAASEKTSKLAKEAKLKITVSEMEGKLRDEYTKLGEKFYSKYANEREIDIISDFIELFKNIDSIKESIKNTNEEILNIKDKVKCASCGKEYDETFEFCPNCGAKTKKEEPKVFEAEIIQENNNEESKNN